MGDYVAKIPAKAVGVDPGDNDLVAPTSAILGSLRLLPADKDLNDGSGLKTAFVGAPDSVAVIEAGATAASKWWSAAIAGGAVISTATIGNVWTNLGAGTQPFALMSLGVVLAAAALGIAYLLGSDVRGRAAATVATIQARQAVATAVIDAARQSAAPNHESQPEATVFPLAPQDVRNGTKNGSAEKGWHAIAGRTDKDGTAFLLTKADQAEWVPSNQVVFN